MKETRTMIQSEMDLMPGDRQRNHRPELEAMDRIGDMTEERLVLSARVLFRSPPAWL